MGLISGLGRSPGGGNGNPFQCSSLNNPMDRGAWWATVHGVTKIQTGFSNWAGMRLNASLVSSVAKLCPTLWPQHVRLPCLSSTPGGYSNSWPLSWWCHPTISSSAIPFSSNLQSFPASGFFPVVMNECESWIIKEAEHRRLDAFELWCWERLLRIPWTARRSIQS